MLAGHKRGVRVGDSSWRHTGNHLFQQLSRLKASGKPSAKSRRSEHEGVEIQVPCLGGIPAPQLGQGKSQTAATGSSHWTDPWTDVWGEQRPPPSSSRLNFRRCASKLSLIPHAGRPTTLPSPTITCNGGLSGKLHLSRAVKGVILPAQPQPPLRLPTPSSALEPAIMRWVRAARSSDGKTAMFMLLDWRACRSDRWPTREPTQGAKEVTRLKTGRPLRVAAGHHWGLSCCTTHAKHIP